MALHVLMMYASAGNLDAFLLSRSHTSSTEQPLSAGDIAATEDIDLLPKAERIKAFKRRRQSGMSGHKVENRGILLLGVDEILHLFADIVEGLAFLVRNGRLLAYTDLKHESSILHLDLKCSNVLLHWREGQVM
jgi:serine/threonine protein kinase